MGTVSHADIEVNDSGELTKAEAGEGEDPITDISTNGNVLRLTTKRTDGSEDSIQMELTLTGDAAAVLRLVVPPDVPAPKPWKLNKLATN